MMLRQNLESYRRNIHSTRYSNTNLNNITIHNKSSFLRDFLNTHPFITNRKTLVTLQIYQAAEIISTQQIKPVLSSQQNSAPM